MQCNLPKTKQTNKKTPTHLNNLFDKTANCFFNTLVSLSHFVGIKYNQFVVSANQKTVAIESYEWHYNFPHRLCNIYVWTFKHSTYLSLVEDSINVFFTNFLHKARNSGLSQEVDLSYTRNSMIFSHPCQRQLWLHLIPEYTVLWTLIHNLRGEK